VISLVKGVLLRSQKLGNLTQSFRTPEKQSAKNKSGIGRKVADWQSSQKQKCRIGADIFKHLLLRVLIFCEVNIFLSRLDSRPGIFGMQVKSGYSKDASPIKNST
jgi:hypothetical protein